MDKQPLYGMDRDELIAWMKEAGLPGYRADQLLQWVYQKHITTLKEASNFSEDLQKKLAESFMIHALHLEEAKRAVNQESIKFLFRTNEGRLLESVLISQKGRRTICVSTQLGCKVGCIFCASGKGKFGRNLSAGEIVEQVALIEKETGERITNVVYMGMGEPLDNFEPTMKSLKILQAPWGFQIGSRRITVSTSGITPKIVEFVKRSEGRVRLSVSLHSSKEKMRSELVPINKKYTLEELTRTLNELHTRLKREITFEYTVIKGMNDSIEEAKGVAKIAKPLKAKVNLIPYNPIREMDFETPAPVDIERFQKILEQQGIRVTVRQTAGRSIDAACGQLRLDRENEDLVKKI